MISDYKAEDFSQMMFPFFVMGDKNALECFPVLAKFKEFNAPLEILPFNKVIKYIGFCYDKGSPLQKIDDMVKKKVTATLLAGFEPNDKGRFEKQVDEMLQGQNLIVNLMIVRYCRMMHSRSYMLLAVGNETLQNTMKQLLAFVPKGEDELKQTTQKTKILSEAKTLAADMDSLSLEILSGDNNIVLNKILYAVSDMVEEEYIKLSPEDFADQWPITHPIITAKVNEEHNEV